MQRKASGRANIHINKQTKKQTNGLLVNLPFTKQISCEISNPRKPTRFAKRRLFAADSGRK